jgi:hypothetical protein
LLDTYEAERHPVAARVLRLALAQVELSIGTPRVAAVREVLGDVMALAEPRRRYAAIMSGLDIAYGPGGAHPLVGRRMPDLDLAIDGAIVHAYALLHAARPVIIDLGGGIGALDGWRDRVRVVRATYAGAWELPVIGAVAAPAAVLVRPDGYVAWVGAGADDALVAALTTWFGPPR